MKNIIAKSFRIFWKICSYLLIAILLLELFSFLAISTINFFIYGRLKDGTKSEYDAYTLYTSSFFMPVFPPVFENPDSPNLRHIWFFGGSTMRAGEAHPVNTIPSMVIQELNTQDSKTSYSAENFGISSYNSLMETKLLVREYAERERWPDLVVFYDGINDCNYFSVYRHYQAHESMPKVKGLIESYHKSPVGIFKPIYAAVSASFSKELYDKFVYTFTPLTAESPATREFIDFTLRRYDFVDRLVKAHGGKFQLFLQPVYWAEQCSKKEAVPEHILAQEGVPTEKEEKFTYVRKNMNLLYSLLEEALKDRPYYMNLRDSLCERTEAAYTHDGVHNTDYGRAMVAKAMLPAIQKALPDTSEKEDKLTGELGMESR